MITPNDIEQYVYRSIKGIGDGLQPLVAPTQSAVHTVAGYAVVVAKYAWAIAIRQNYFFAFADIVFPTVSFFVMLSVWRKVVNSDKEYDEYDARNVCTVFAWIGLIVSFVFMIVCAYHGLNRIINPEINAMRDILNTYHTLKQGDAL
jgi:hypothetical protein